MFFGPLHLFKGTLIRQESWNDIVDSPIGVPYLALKEKRKNITLTPVDKEDAEKLLDMAKTVLEDHSRANELLPLGIKYSVIAEKAYNEAYFREVQQLAAQLQDCTDNTNWDKGELLYFYMQINPRP